MILIWNHALSNLTLSVYERGLDLTELKGGDLSISVHGLDAILVWAQGYWYVSFDVQENDLLGADGFWDLDWLFCVWRPEHSESISSQETGIPPLVSLGVETCCDKMVDEIAWGDYLSIDLVAEISEGDGGDGCLGSFLAEINTVDEFR